MSWPKTLRCSGQFKIKTSKQMCPSLSGEVTNWAHNSFFLIQMEVWDRLRLFKTQFTLNQLGEERYLRIERKPALSGKGTMDFEHISHTLHSLRLTPRVLCTLIHHFALRKEVFFIPVPTPLRKDLFTDDFSKSAVRNWSPSLPSSLEGQLFSRMRM